MESGECAARPRANDSDYHSTAFNFYDHIRGHVDPRTGMYTARIDLSTGDGNALRGPSFEFHLVYSPLQSVDEGFGEGWHLQLTALDLTSKRVSLATGEAFFADALIPGEPCHFSDRKLETFIVTPGARLQEAVVEHATGLTEFLARPGDAGETLKPVRIAKENGDGITLTWTQIPSGVYGLSRVTDDEGVDLLQLDYISAEETVLTLPGGASGPYVTFRFLREAYLLREVELTTVMQNNAIPIRDDEYASWRFNYTKPLDPPALSLLQEVVHPTGIIEEVQYNERALRMPPGAPRDFMPAVVRRVQRRVAAPTEVIDESRYTFDLFGDSNFYGYPIVSQWATANDQLLHLVGASRFRYGSVEARIGAEGEGSVLTIEREYNQFHLIVAEITTRGYVVHAVTTTYGYIENEAFARQPAAFQLPEEVRTTAYDRRDPDVKRVTFEKNAYDAAGNTLSHYDSATGLTETMAYYPVEGATDNDGAVLCPPDPVGLVHRLRSATTIPGPGGGPVKTISYQYLSIPTQRDNRPSARRSDYVQAWREALTVEENGTSYEQARNEKYFSTDHGPWHGCLMSETHQRDGIVTRLVYRYDADVKAITTTTDMYIQGALAASQSESLQRVTGLVIADTDVAGNRVERTYDPMGRMTAEVDHPDRPDYASVLQWHYQVSTVDHWTEQRGKRGLIHRTHLDERGHVARVDGPLPDGGEMVIRTSRYDNLGQRVEDVRFDRVDLDKSVRLAVAYHYDDWGNADRIVSPDGSEQRSTVRLVLDQEGDGRVVTQVTTWEQVKELRTDWTTTETDAAGLMLRQSSGSWDGSVRLDAYATQSWVYDGLGRCTETRDVFDRVLKQSWDADDRLMTSTLADGTVMTREYAKGTRGADVIALSVTSPEGETRVLGMCEYDERWRLKRETSGSLTTFFDYPDMASEQPSRKERPSGAVLTMRHDRRLGECLTAAELTPSGGTPTMTAEASYDLHTGTPLRFGSPGGEMEIETDGLGRLTTQHVTLTGDRRRTSKTVASPGGRDLEKWLADGSLQRFVYDDLGRLSWLSDSDVETSFAYDEFSRLASRVSRVSGDSQEHELSDARTYDGRGRLATQTWVHRDGEITASRRVDMTWRIDDKLIGRRWFDAQETSVREEMFDYDARGRLAMHRIDGTSSAEYPVDEAGHAYVKQVFLHDAFDNLLSCETHLLDGRVNMATFRYDAVDTDRLIAYSNSLPDYPGQGAEVTLAYDEDGNLVDDGLGLTLQWDGMGLLVAATPASGTEISYTHGPDGRVCATHRAGITAFRHYDNGAVACEVTRDDGRRYVHTTGGPVAESLLTGALRDTWLLGVDAQGSVVMTGGDDRRERVYGAFGHTVRQASEPRLAFAGQVVEETVPFYILRGRVYSPLLRRFLSPDPTSPFGAGGMNRYAYCGGDPVNRIDPSGQAWWDWVLAGIGLAVSIAAAVASGGALVGAVAAAASTVGAAASTPAMVGLVGAAVLDTLALATEIGSVVALATNNEQLDQIFGIVGLAADFGPLGLTKVAKSLGKSAGKSLPKASTVSLGIGSSRHAPIKNFSDLPPGRQSTYDLQSGQPNRAVPEWRMEKGQGRFKDTVHYTADTEVNERNDMSDIIARAVRENPNGYLYVHVGMHGADDGKNWIGNLPKKLAEKFAEVFEARGGMYGERHNREVRVINRSTMNRDEIESALALPGIHIHFFCFSAVDEVYLNLFNLRRITVFRNSGRFFI